MPRRVGSMPGMCRSLELVACEQAEEVATIMFSYVPSTLRSVRCLCGAPQGGTENKDTEWPT